MEQLETLIEGRAAQQFPIVLGEQATINAVTQRVERRAQNSGITDAGIAANAVGDAVGINTTGVWSTSSATLGIPFTHAYLRNIKHVNEGDFAYQELIPAYGNDVPTQYRWKDQGVWGAWKTSIEYRLADSALNTANAAKNSANAATATANTAQTAADAAKTAANNANAVAVDAQGKANTADANANSANAKAITAQNGVDVVTKVTKDIKLVDDYVSWENRASYTFKCVSGKGASINSNGNFHLFGAAGELTAAILGSSGDLVGSAWGASAGELGDLSAWLGARGLNSMGSRGGAGGFTVNGSIPIVEFHVPSKIACMWYLEDSGIMRLARSNGAGGWVASLIDVNLHASTYLFHGQIEATGNIIAFSDRRLKDDIKKTSGLSAIAKLEGVQWVWNKDHNNAGEAGTGLIAQDVQKVLPEAITEGEDGILGLNYNGVIGLLVNAVNELTQRVKELEGAKSSDRF